MTVAFLFVITIYLSIRSNVLCKNRLPRPIVIITQHLLIFPKQIRLLELLVILSSYHLTIIESLFCTRLGNNMTICKKILTSLRLDELCKTLLRFGHAAILLLGVLDVF